MVIASWYPTATSYIGVFVREQVRALAEEHDVAVVAPQLGRFRDWMKVPRVRSGSVDLEDGVPTVRPIVTPRLPRMRRLALEQYRRAVSKAVSLLGETWGTPDLLHAHVVLPAGWAAAGVARELGIPMFLTEHSAPFSMHLHGVTNRWAARSALRSAARVVAVGSTLESEICDFEPQARVTVIPNAIDTAFFAPAPPARSTGETRDESCHVATVGALIARKGIDVLLRALAIALKSDPDLNLRVTVAGDGPDRDALLYLARHLGLERRVRFVGQLDQAAVRDLLRSTDLFVLPSRKETFSVVTVEAMACGVPVIVTRCGGPEDYVAEPAGLVVEPDSPAELAAAIGRAARGTAGLSGDVARQIAVDRFSFSAFRRATNALYDTLEVA